MAESTELIIDALFTVLKRTTVTKPEALSALREVSRLVSRIGFATESCVRELRGILALRGIVGSDGIEKEGGHATAAELGGLLGLSEASVRRRRRLGKLLAYYNPRLRMHLYPKYQVRDGKVLEGVEECIECMTRLGLGPRGQALFMLSPLTGPDGGAERAIAHLREGNPDKAIRLLEASRSR